MNAAPIPLIAHFAPGMSVGRREAGPVDVEQFLGTARALAQRLPPAAYCLNLCEDRLNFALALAAALLQRTVCLLPPTRAKGALRDLEAMYAPGYCFVDRPATLSDCTQVDLREWPRGAASDGVPAIDAGQLAITLFTSGSTGAPRPHSKTWGALAAGARVLRERLSLSPGGAMLGTVPAQHMWGLEATVMLPLQSGCAIDSRSPLLPADVASILAEMTAPRWLVTVPLHIDACVAMNVEMPAMAGVLSATSRLNASLARAFEGIAGAPIFEIYGSTETGAVGTRQPAREEPFELLDGLDLRSDAGQWHVAAGHVGESVALQDRLDVSSRTRFRVGARLRDLVKIGGKRASLATLNAELRRIPGVVDGVFWVPEHDRETLRLLAFVVAPGVSRSTILAALRDRIDRAFLPRPLVVVDALPRDALGKLPRARMAELALQSIDVDAPREM
jgi:acyl-coenzyme A synthetase/AMP-(fatty) acid ligase